MSHAEPNDREREATRRLVERLAEQYRPEPLGAAARTRFSAQLRERIEARETRPAWPPWLPLPWPTLATAAAVLALGWAIWPSLADRTPSTSPVSDPSAAPGFELAGVDRSWESEVLLVDVDPDAAEDAYLPDEYQAIAFLFLDGDLDGV